jgi:hypothetical protein
MIVINQFTHAFKNSCQTEHDLIYYLFITIESKAILKPANMP